MLALDQVLELSFTPFEVCLGRAVFLRDEAPFAFESLAVVLLIGLPISFKLFLVPLQVFLCHRDDFDGFLADLFAREDAGCLDICDISRVLDVQ